MRTQEEYHKEMIRVDEKIKDYLEKLNEDFPYLHFDQGKFDYNWGRGIAATLELRVAAKAYHRFEDSRIELTYDEVKNKITSDLLLKLESTIQKLKGGDTNEETKTSTKAVKKPKGGKGC
jgi:hypothetical protein